MFEVFLWASEGLWHLVEDESSISEQCAASFVWVMHSVNCVQEVGYSDQHVWVSQNRGQ